MGCSEWLTIQSNCSESTLSKSINFGLTDSLLAGQHIVGNIECVRARDAPFGSLRKRSWCTCGFGSLFRRKSPMQ